MLVVAGAAAMSLAAFTYQQARPDPGPAWVPPSNFSSVHFEAGDTFTDGFGGFRHRGSGNAVITDVRMDGGEGLELLGIKIADESRDMGAIQYIDSWPPTTDPDLPQESIKPLDTPVKPHPAGDVELLIGYRVVGEGKMVRMGYWVDYTVDGKEYSAYHPTGLAVCTDKPAGKCNPPRKWIEGEG